MEFIKIMALLMIANKLGVSDSVFIFMAVMLAIAGLCNFK